MSTAAQLVIRDSVPVQNVPAQAVQPNETEQLRLENQRLRTQVQTLTQQLQNLNNQVDTVVANRLQVMVQQAAQQIQNNAQQQIQQSVQQAVNQALAAQANHITDLQNRVNVLTLRNARLAARQNGNDCTECVSGAASTIGVIGAIWAIVRCFL